MAADPDYPCDHSERYPVAVRDSFRYFSTTEITQGIIQNAEGDVRNWVTSHQATGLQRGLTTALAYLDIADTAAAANHQDIQQAIKSLAADVAGITAQLALISDLLGVVVPHWTTKTEVDNGGDPVSGDAVPSAASLGLQVDFQFDQKNPKFANEEVEWTDPPAGHLAARGSTIRVMVNMQA